MMVHRPLARYPADGKAVDKAMLEDLKPALRIEVIAAEASALKVDQVQDGLNS